MSRGIVISGTGAVSPAGWGVAALLDGGIPAPVEIERPLGGNVVRTRVLRVPAGTAPKSARLRRTSPISRFAAAATVEALGEERLAGIARGERYVGVIFTLMNGCVNYSNRFFAEALADPSLASPILFPETVFNAPSSHLSAFIGSAAPNDTLIGDGTAFFSGIDLAAEWLMRGDVDGCVVVAAEEADWLSAEGLALYDGRMLAAEGAGAVFLELGEGPVNLLRLPDPLPFTAMPRAAAAVALREKLGAHDDGRTLLVDGRSGSPRTDAAEERAWGDWKGPRVSPRLRLGEGMGTSAAWQAVVATAAVASGEAERAVVAAVGGNQQAGGMLIGALSSGTVRR